MSTPPDWGRLEPRGLYARALRPALGIVLTLSLLPAALAVALPIAAANLAVFGDPRKVLYRQERVGRRGDAFHILKFRTMRDTPGTDAERLTRFGRFLRARHLDEIPQILNVLAGRMAWIGPRPETVAVEAWARGCVPGFEERLVLKPGVTGLAQVVQGSVGQDESAYARKLELNREYLRQVSLQTDGRILLATARLLMLGRPQRTEAPAADGPTPLAEPQVRTERRAA